MKGWFPTLKAIILCGEGEEGLAPLTLERPLPLLSLFDKPLLAHQAGPVSYTHLTLPTTPYV